MRKTKLEFIEKRKWSISKLKFIKQWYWRLTASNGRILDASSEGFFNKVDCIHNARKTGWALVEQTKNIKE
tara:strand:+ start:2297 stop:2509 length:213 start_codon:yes stop_codon:yes gene_type:complete